MPPKRLRYIGRLIVAILLYPLAAAAPRAGNRWVFGHSGDLFAGNPKFLFLWLRLYRPDIDARWITGSEATRRMLAAEGLPVVRRWSPAGIAAALRASVYAFSHDPADVNLPLSRGARHLNLWHGVGLKALHAGARPASGLRKWLRSFLYLPYDIVVSTSDMMQAHFARQFGLPRERCPQLGYPRLDWASDPRLAEQALAIDRAAGFRLRPKGQREVYLYVPTFRDTGRPFLDAALPDLAALDALLTERDALLYVKPHPRSADRLPQEHRRIRRWPDAIDPSVYLGQLTGLITDYSSILYDYLAVRDAGAILYTFDQHAYLTHDRVLAHDFDSNVAGVRVATFEQLCAVLASGSALDSMPEDEVAALRRRFWGSSTGPASAAIVRHMEAEAEVVPARARLREAAI